MTNKISVSRLALAAFGMAILPSQAADLTWTGAINGTWNTTAANWIGGASVYTAGDNVIFNDSGLTPNPSITSAIALSVGSMNVANSSGAYSVSLNAGSSLTGTSLTKTNSGTLSFGQTGAVSFGSTSLQAGTLAIRSSSFNGGAISVAGPVTFTGATAETTSLNGTGLIGAGDLTLAPFGGSRILVNLDTSTFTGTLRASANGQVNISSVASNLSQAKVILTGNTIFQGTVTGSLQIGEIQAGSGNVLGKYVNTAQATVYEIGALNTYSSIAGTVQNGGLTNATTPAPTTGLVALTKVGTGTLSLTGANTYTGATTVNAGTLLVGDGASGSITSAATVTAGALYGNLTVGNVTTAATTIGNSAGAADAIFGAGLNVIGRFASSSSLTLLSDANFVFDLNSAAETTDIATFAGIVTLNGTFTLRDIGTGAVNWSVNDSFTVVSGSSRNGVFANLADGETITANGVTYLADYTGTGLTLTVTAVPEPGSLTLAALGLGLVLTKRRRNNP